MRTLTAITLAATLGLAAAGCYASAPTSVAPTCSATTVGNPAGTVDNVTVSGTSNIADGTNLHGVLTGDSGSGPVVLAQGDATFGYQGAFTFTLPLTITSYSWIATGTVSLTGGPTLCSATLVVPAQGNNVSVQ